VSQRPPAEDGGAVIARGVHRGRVAWMDTDAAGIHHNTAITRYVEGAEAELMRARGLQDYLPRAPRVRYEVDFESPLRAGQEFTSTVDLVHIGTSSMTFAFEVWGEAADGRPRQRAAAGRLVTVHVAGGHAGHGQLQSSPWPAGWVAALHRA
jgi:acyl-CoA thioester hydrolase